MGQDGLPRLNEVNDLRIDDHGWIRSDDGCGCVVFASHAGFMGSAETIMTYRTFFTQIAKRYGFDGRDIKTAIEMSDWEHWNDKIPEDKKPEARKQFIQLIPKYFKSENN